MDMLNLLIVDDEMVILHGIVKIIREGKTPFTRIESALDACEALSVMEDFAPDLIITDIHMPEMNGLELIQEVKERGACGRFIILTGHDEFEYARQALRHQVIDYLLKPINKMELLDLLRTVAKTILEAEQDGAKHARSDSRYSFHVEKILRHIDQHYHRDLSLDQCSELTGLHPNYISQLFKKETGVSFVQYLHHYRIEKAKELLKKDGGLPVQVIGNQVGFENPQHFMKVFKKLVGCTPGAYRESDAKGDGA